MIGLMVNLFLKLQICSLHNKQFCYEQIDNLENHKANEHFNLNW